MLYGLKRRTLAAVGDRVLGIAARSFHRVRRVHRPAADGSPAFDLAYVRSGPETDAPAVIIPGGPGLASVMPYGALRRQSRSDGLDVIMVEHRGVALSRSDSGGADLPQSAMWVNSVVDDIAAVLDKEGVERAFIAGSSYGSYLASAFATKYSGRVRGMLLDSALQSAGDLQIERARIRSLFWDADTLLASRVRKVTERGENQRVLLDVVRAGFELCGEGLVTSMLGRRLNGRADAVWEMLETYAARDASIVGIAGYYEFARAGAIGFRELDYAPAPDGLPLDPALTYSKLAGFFPPFAGEQFNILAATPTFVWPLVLLVGSRDVRTPAAIAYRSAALAPQSTVVPITNGHSALDTHLLAFEKTLKLLVRGQEDRLAALAPALDSLPRRGAGEAFARLLRATDRAEGVLKT